MNLLIQLFQVFHKCTHGIKRLPRSDRASVPCPHYESGCGSRAHRKINISSEAEPHGNRRERNEQDFPEKREGFGQRAEDRESVTLIEAVCRGE